MMLVIDIVLIIMFATIVSTVCWWLLFDDAAESEKRSTTNDNSITTGEMLHIDMQEVHPMSVKRVFPSCVNKTTLTPFHFSCTPINMDWNPDISSSSDINPLTDRKYVRPMLSSRDEQRIVNFLVTLVENNATATTKTLTTKG